MSKSHTLARAEIRQRVGAQSFARGEAYANAGNIFNTRQMGTVLKSDCYGSGANVYRLWAKVEKGKIVQAECSCPIGDGGYCKHLAALLLTWLAEPKTFRQVEEPNSALERRSKEELIALVKQMLKRDPDLETLLELPLPGSKRASDKVDPKIYRGQVAAAFRGGEYEWGSEDEIAREVDATLDLGFEFLEQEDLQNAVAVFEAVAEEVLKRYEEFSDETGAMSELVGRAVEGMGTILQTNPTEQEFRQRVLRALFDVYKFDIDYGGVGLSDEVPELILKYASNSEKQGVTEWVRGAMKKRSGDSWSDNWHRQVYGGFALKLQKGQLDDETYIRLCREAGRLDDLVERLLKLGRLDEAQKEAARAEDYLLLQLADLFVRRQHSEIAESLVLERVPKSKDPRVLEWLMKRGKAKGDSAAALEWARQIFDLEPSLEQYKRVRKMAKPDGNWRKVRAELVENLNAKKEYDLLTQIYLDEKDISHALEAVEKIKLGTVFWHYGLHLNVAKAAEAKHPRDAARLYRKAADRIIGQRSRAEYRDACRYLVRVRKLYQRLGTDAVAEWKKYLEKVREATKPLRAFREEMVRARL